MELVSIITPSYNSELFISQTIESVLSQTYQNWEMIIVDDVSPDKSNDIVEEYSQRDSRIKLIRLEKNSGPAIARNTAIETAQGRYIAFLDADDVWLPEKLQKQIAFMQEKHLDFTYCSYVLIDEIGNHCGQTLAPEKLNYTAMLSSNKIGCLTAIYDTKKLGKIYMPDILKRQDYGLWLKIFKIIGTTQGLLEPLAVYRIRKNSVSSNKLALVKYHYILFREHEKLSIFKSFYYVGVNIMSKFLQKRL
ncbi:glycosyltransferase family 2 protein [Sulfurospirillum barnesii]|uniref:Glycosyl transferase n=1 Tax=Sulfurospirillum barnesii (strain ATCC 700032 / DSM 10660 / SES-3) TaxID=760154 RepID=I3XYW3_SULBS|nr:glycosyltransferase family 2 protein [Sulfurospirillum barnesii]AFL69137.1 glycosyl transferase [Sulfurospirillum barnesii SES-3]